MSSSNISMKKMKQLQKIKKYIKRFNNFPKIASIFDAKALKY